MAAKSVLDVVKSLQKESGDMAVTITPEIVDVERVPSGVFPFDYSSGGGFPMGKFSIIYGIESSGKTNLALKTMGNFQLLHPDKPVVFIDVENSFDPKWATAMGVDMEGLVMSRPTFGEQAVDWVDAFLKTADVGMIVVDSLAALTPEREADGSAERQQVGGSSLLISRMIRKCNVNMSVAAREGRHPTVILINQTRYKVGMVYGDPETQPGGQAVKHASGLTVRCYGKNITNKNVSAEMPALKETSIIIKKWKVPIVSASCKYHMVMIPHEGQPVGYVKDIKTLCGYLKELGWLTNEDKKGWKLLDKEDRFSSEVKAQAFIQSDPALLRALKKLVIEEEVKKVHQEDLMPKEFEE